MKWFKHESNAHNDARLEKVLMRFGADGYGLYWYCIELIAGKVSAENITFELEHDAEVLAYRLKIDSLRVEEIMRYFISIGLFEMSDNTITCVRLAKSLDERWTRSEELKAVIRQSEDRLQTVYKPLPLEEKRREEKRINSTAKAVHVENSSSSRPVPYQKIIDLYHERLPMLPRVQKLTPARKQQIRARWQARDELSTLDEWDEYFRHVAESKFLTGQAQPMNGRPVFRADLDFLIKQANLVKVAEGKYHR